MGGRFVEHDQRSGGEQGAGERQSLPLAEGESLPAAAQVRVEAAVRDDGVEADGGRGGPELVVVRVRAGAGEDLAQGAGREHGPLGEQRDLVPEAAALQLAHVGRGAVGGDHLGAALLGLQQAQQHLHGGGLPGSGGAGQRGDAAGADLDLRRVRGEPVARGDAHAAQGEGRAGEVGGGTGPVGRGVLVEHLEGRADRGESVGGGVVLGADIAQRLVHLGGEDQHRERRGEVHLPVDEPHADRDGDQRHAQGREQLEHHRGEEGELQRAHGGGAVTVAEGLHHPLRAVLAAEGAQGGQALDEVQQLGPQGAHVRQQPLGAAHGHLPHQDHEQRHQRQRDQGDHGAERIEQPDRQQAQRGDRRREHQLGDVAHQIGAQLLQPRRRQRRHVRAPAGPGPRAEPGGVGEDAGAQIADRGGRGAVRGRLLDQHRPRPHGEREDQQGEHPRGVRGDVPLDEQPRAEVRDHQRRDDHGRGLDEPEDHGPRDMSARGAHLPDQSGVQRCSPRARGGAHSWPNASR